MAGKILLLGSTALLFLADLTAAVSFKARTISTQNAIGAEPATIPEYPPECEPKNLLSFTPGSVLTSNLGGKGPSSGLEALVYGNVTFVQGRTIDLKVTVHDSEYTPKDASVNGLHYAYGIINVMSGTTVNLRFSLVDRETNKAVALNHPFLFSFFDLDTGGELGPVETISASGFRSYNVTADTEINVTTLTHGASFTGTKFGNGLDNPMHPLSLTTGQMNRAVTLSFPGGVSEFHATLNATKGTGARGARNYMFSGPSTIVCPTRALCSTYSCPSGFDPRPYPEHIACAGAKCGKEDVASCCCQADAASYTFDGFQSDYMRGLGFSFQGMAPGVGAIDMHLKFMSDYASYNESHTGVVDSYGSINVAANSSVSLNLGFTDRVVVDKLFTMPSFRMAFLDLDGWKSDEDDCFEQLIVGSLSSYSLTNATEVTAYAAGNYTIFTSTEPGNVSNNPLGFPLSASQMAQMVVLTFPSASDVNFTLMVGPGCRTGRNFLFSRPAAVGYCPST